MLRLLELPLLRPLELLPRLLVLLLRLLEEVLLSLPPPCRSCPKAFDTPIARGSSAIADTSVASLLMRECVFMRSPCAAATFRPALAKQLGKLIVWEYTSGFLNGTLRKAWWAQS